MGRAESMKRRSMLSETRLQLLLLIMNIRIHTDTCMLILANQKQELMVMSTMITSRDVM